MADPRTLSDDIHSLLGTLEQADLVEIARRAGIEGLRRACRAELGDQDLAGIVAALFPHYSESRVAAVATQIGLTAIKNSCSKMIADAPGPWRAVIRAPDKEAVAALRAHQGPAILVFWHFGPVNMLSLGFRRIGVSPLIITKAEPSRCMKTPEMLRRRLPVVQGNSRQSIIALRRSVEHLKKGGKVAVAMDGSLGKQDISVPFLGRRFSVSRGTAGLARLTGAPLIPCAMQWEPGSWNMAIRVFDRLPEPVARPEDVEAFEQELMTNAARCFDEFGRRYPGQLRLDQLGRLADSPRLDG